MNKLISLIMLTGFKWM